MKVLLAVIEELCTFAYRALSGALPYMESSPPTDVSVSRSAIQIQHPSPLTPKLTEHSAYKSQRISAYVKRQQGLSTLKTGYQYFIGAQEVYFYPDPVVAFDGAMHELAYGQSVRLVALQGRWAQVRLGGQLGWIFKDVLRENANSVYPRFEDNEIYVSDHFETIKLRMCIDDAFGGGRGAFPLMAPEYIQYKLQQIHKSIEWDDKHSRIAGTWQRKLRGHLGIHIGITPKTDSVMEYSIDDRGYQAFVEAVFPDGSIHITQIGKDDESQYTNEMLNQSQWKELRPVFIDVL